MGSIVRSSRRQTPLSTSIALLALLALLAGKLKQPIKDKHLSSPIPCRPLLKCHHPPSLMRHPSCCDIHRDQARRAGGHASYQLSNQARWARHMMEWILSKKLTVFPAARCCKLWRKDSDSRTVRSTDVRIDFWGMSSTEYIFFVAYCLH